ncbi:hypothetical protein ABT061_45650 [Streptosporangium sp. NPDC002544]|uniref:hypothetical protein n=1 Tax=Streptosporangium sp. NPDC002544 TaxID=3154538 RepID=UPI003329214F
MDGSARRSTLLVLCRFLLIALILGVAGMHTLGHLDHRRGHDGTPAAFGHAFTADHGVPKARTVLRPTLMPQAGQLVSERDDTPPALDPSSVCLAVLTSFLLLLIGMAPLWTRQISQARSADASPTLLVARPPPRRTALRLARLSVLRV